MVPTLTLWSAMANLVEKMMTDGVELDLTPPVKVKGSKKEKAPVEGEVKAEKAPKAPKEPKAPKADSNRAKLGSLYPEDAALTLLATSNPKKVGSAAAAIFEFYKEAKTVGDFFAATAKNEFNGKPRPGTYADITYDVGHGFIKVG